MSTEALKRMLEALGVNASDQDRLDVGRRERFRQHAERVLPITLVVGDDRLVPVTLQADGGGSLEYEIALETGEQITGSVEVCELPLHANSQSIINDGGCTFAPSSGTASWVPQASGRSERPRLRQSAFDLCPERAYLPERLQSGGRTAGLNITLYGLRSERTGDAAISPIYAL